MAKAGRRIGQHVNKRDERGWMIPRPGTVRRRVYDLLIAGKDVGSIHKALGISYASCVMHKRNIEQADRANAQRYNMNHPDEPIAVPGGTRLRLGLQEAAMIAGIIQDEIGGEICTPEWSRAAADRIVSALSTDDAGGR